MKLRSFLSKFKTHRGFQFLLDLSTALLCSVFILLVVPLFFDRVTDPASFGFGFIFCMISDGFFGVIYHHIRKAYYYRHVSQPERARCITFEDYENEHY